MKLTEDHQQHGWTLLCPNFLSSKGQLNGDLMEHIFGSGPRSINSFLRRNQWAKTKFRFGLYGNGLVFRCLSMAVYRQTRLSKVIALQKHRRVLHVLFPFIGVLMALWMEWLPLTKCQARLLCFYAVMYFWWSGQDITADWAQPRIVLSLWALKNRELISKSVSFPLHLCTIYKSSLINQISIFYWIGKEWNITKSYTLVGSNTEVMKWFRCGIFLNLHGKWFWFNQLKCRFRKYIETQFRKNKSFKKNNPILNVHRIILLVSDWF